jgi:hypothetical protein
LPAGWSCMKQDEMAGRILRQWRRCRAGAGKMASTRDGAARKQ